MRFIEGGDLVFDALAYGTDVPTSTSNYFQNEIASISNTLNAAGQSFFSNVKSLYDNINNSDAIRMARNAIQAAATLFLPDTVTPLISLAQFQTAGLVMQRYVMANPVVRQAYHAQRIDGYSDTYVDRHPKDIGENHYDYRRVMNAVVQTDEEADTWFVKFYPDELVEGDKELSHDEKVDIIKTWDLMEMFINAGENDPTSVYGSKM